MTVMTGWFLLNAFYYIRATFYYLWHKRRCKRKDRHRAQEEALRIWKKNHESDWVNYRFNVQMSLVQAKKLPAHWKADIMTPPCPSPPIIEPLCASDLEWDDVTPWLKPPNFCRYWCSRHPKFNVRRQAFNEQHLFRHKTMDEYTEWKRRNDENVQEAIRNHPIASKFLQLSKNVNEYSVTTQKY